MYLSQWNNFKNTSFLIYSATISDSGKYLIKGHNIFGCDTMISDSIFINIVPGIKTTFFDTICQGEHYTDNGFDTIFMIPGDYTFDSISNCDTLSLEISVAPSHYFFTYYDSICEGERYIGHGIDTVFNKKGIYSKYYSYKCDSLIKIQLYIKEVTRVSLGKDIILCSELDFPVKINAGTEFITYQWNTFDSTSFIYASKVGTYYVTATNKEGCEHSDSISILLEKIPVKIEILTLDFCENFSSTLKVTTQSDSILWNTGQTQHQIEITKPGTYTVTVYKSNCFNTDSISIDTCAFNLFLQTAITPYDNNNLNDYFYLILPKKHQIKTIHIDIFDRWGNRVYNSEDINFKWQGEIDGKIAHNNFFNYVLKISLDDNRHYIYKGILLVM